MNSDDDFDDIICSNAHEYINTLSLGNELWWQESKLHSKCNWIFRGHSDCQYELIPSLYREKQGIREYENTINLMFDKIITTIPCIKSALSNTAKTHIPNEAKQNFFCMIFCVLDLLKYI